MAQILERSVNKPKATLRCSQEPAIEHPQTVSLRFILILLSLVCLCVGHPCVLFTLSFLIIFCINFSCTACRLPVASVSSSLVFVSWLIFGDGDYELWRTSVSVSSISGHVVFKHIQPVFFVYGNEGCYTSAFIICHVSFSLALPQGIYFYTFLFPIVAFLLASGISTCCVTCVSYSDHLSDRGFVWPLNCDPYVTLL